MQAEAPAETKRIAYFWTFPHPRESHAASGERLAPSSKLAKEEVLEKLLDAFRLRFLYLSISLSILGVLFFFHILSHN